MNEYDERIKEQAQKSRDPEAAIALYELMSQISEDQWCAGWLVECSHLIWAQKEALSSDLSRRQGLYLERLAGMCDGWWHIRGGGFGPVEFVPLNEWLKIHKTYTSKKEAWEKALDISREIEQEYLNPMSTKEYTKEESEALLSRVEAATKSLREVLPDEYK